MNAKTDESHGAVAGQVERSVRPHAPLPAPDLYAQELIANGGGVWLGCIEQGICERAHTPGETGDEVRHYYTAETVLRLLAAERERCAKVCEWVSSSLESAAEDAQAMSTGAQSCADQIRAGA